MPKHAHCTLSAADGYPIAARLHLPDDAPRAVVVIASAMGVKQDFYAPFAAWLAERGIAAYTFDYRGMGASRPADLRGFEADLLDWATKDCAAVLDDAAARWPDAPIHWLGHSVGAQLLGLVPNRARVKAMLSVAAGSGYWKYNSAPLRWYVPSLWWVVMPLAIRVAGYFPGKTLRMVGDLPAGVAAQWRKWCLHEGYLAAEGPEALAEVEATAIPITAWSMQDDEMMTLRGTRELFRLYARAPVEIRRLRPRDLGVDRIGHFGFFRASMAEALWPMVPAWIEGVSSAA